MLKLPDRILFLRLAAAIGTGLALRFVVGLEPVWWLAWIAPAPLLILALTGSASAAGWMSALAALIGVSANVHYYSRLMPLPAVPAVVLGQALLWVFVVGAARRIVLRYRSWWTVFAYPVLWVMADMLMATFLPDGNWASLAYSQAEVLPVLQLTSLLGVAGLLFVLALVPSALAVGVVFGARLHRPALAYLMPVLLLGGTIGYGQFRLAQTASGSSVVFGMAAIDDPIGPQATPAYADNIWSGYEELVAKLAARGAQVVVLPEKIALTSPLQSEQAARRLGALAARHHVWLAAGMGTVDAGRRLNLAWLFAPDGIRAAEYQKHFMAPAEREFVRGARYSVSTIDGVAYGIAICKDMHFAALGRAYGQQRAAVMLVPAWDFQVDRWMGARITLTRGVENGYAVVRASREGLLTVSDNHGRVIAERRSGPLPGTSLLAAITAAAPQPTLYQRTGDLFGWLCVGAGIAMLAIGRGPKRRQGQRKSDNRTKSWCQV